MGVMQCGLTTGNGIITLDESLQNIDIIWTANSFTEVKF